MANLHTSPVGVKGKISYFFRQTFRRHSGAEYSELFTRGMRGNKGVNRKYPWAYIRLFGLLFILLAVYVLVVRFTANEMFVPTIMAIGGLCFNLPFLVLIYELYPERDLSLMSVLLALLLGGAGANIVSQILYNIVPISNDWMLAVFSGIFEEVPKTAALVLVILGAKKRSPLAGFVLGAAVGCGFSVVEDIGYIFVLSNEMPVFNLTSIVSVTLVRGLTAFCTHTLWSAAIGWAYNLRNKWLANIAFWAACTISCGLHICWDLPLGNVGIGIVYSICVVVVAVECIFILTHERRKVLGISIKQEVAEAAKAEKDEQLSFITQDSPLAQEVVPDDGIAVPVEEVKPIEEAPKVSIYYEEDALTLNASHYKYWRHWGQLCCMLGAFLMAVVGIIYCLLPLQETYGTKKFDNASEFISFMEDELDIDQSSKDKRPFDHSIENDEESTYLKDGMQDRIIQKVKGSDGRYYYYEYYKNTDVITNRVDYFLLYVSVEVDGIPYTKEDVYYDGKLYASYFHITEQEVTGTNISATDRVKDVTERDVTVFIYNPAFKRDLSAWEYASFFIVLGAIAGSAIICYISFKIKSWRVKELCSKKTASSAE